MGSYSSRVQQDLANNVLLLKFVGKNHIPSNNNYWNDLLSFSIKSPPSLEDDKFIFEKSKPLFNQLTSNNLKTGNLRTLLNIFLTKTSEVFQTPKGSTCESDCVVVHNALFIARYCVQQFVHRYPEAEIIKQIEAQGPSTSSSTEVCESTYIRVIDSLYDILIDLPVTDSTYILHCECINVLLVLLSIELFTTQSVQEFEIFKIIYETNKAEPLLKILLLRFREQQLLPSTSGGSLILDIAADIMGLLLPQNSNTVSLLARNAVLLTVVLINQYVGQNNPYRDCLSSSADDLNRLYITICSVLDQEETTLLLYHLLHRNHHFRTYLLSRTDIQLLVAPILKTIYNANDSSCHHMYMSLIILLILTEDLIFNRKIHEIIIKNVTWYTDRLLSEISLGGLIILVTTRTVQYNLLKMRDEYLHTNCLAALANMSSQFSNLNTYVCQRLVGLFEVLAKTYNRAKQELVAIEKALRIILEVLNSCLSNQLMSNANLIYTLLYKKNIFDSFRNNPAFQDIINNLDQVLNYFISKLEQEDDPYNDVDTVLRIIVESSPKWPSHRLQKFPELKFKYVEEEKPEEFFVPYVWSLLSEYSNIYLQSSLFKKS